MALSNTAIPKYYGMFRDAVMQGSVNRGKVKTSDILSVAGDVLAVGASATAIALQIYNMKHK